MTREQELDLLTQAVSRLTIINDFGNHKAEASLMLEFISFVIIKKMEIPQLESVEAFKRNFRDMQELCAKYAEENNR